MIILVHQLYTIMLVQRLQLSALFSQFTVKLRLGKRHQCSYDRLRLVNNPPLVPDRTYVFALRRCHRLIRQFVTSIAPTPNDALYR